MEEGGTKRKAAFVTTIRAPPHLWISLRFLPPPLAQPALRWKVRLNVDIGEKVQQQAAGAERQLSSERIKKLMLSPRLDTLHFSRMKWSVDIDIQVTSPASFLGGTSRKKTKATFSGHFSLCRWLS